MKQEANTSTSEMLVELQKVGLNFAHLARELGEERSFLHNVRCGNIRKYPTRLLVKNLRQKASAMKRCSVTNDNLDSLLRGLGIRESYLAKRLGISRQAFNEAKLKGFSPERLESIEDVLKDVASVLSSLLRAA